VNTFPGGLVQKLKTMGVEFQKKQVERPKRVEKGGSWGKCRLSELGNVRLKKTAGRATARRTPIQLFTCCQGERGRCKDSKNAGPW